MADLNETPTGNRIRIAFFGLRNAGKSTLVNAFTGQSLAIVSDVPGTTTDPVSKAMEILPLGPCLVTDTAGLDDVGTLGVQRVEKTLSVLEKTDIAIWVDAGPSGTDVGASSAAAGHDGRARCPQRAAFDDRCSKLKVTVLDYHRGDSVEELKKRIASLQLADQAPELLDGLVHPGETVVCVCPIDESAPKGRLILPQVQVIRDCLDRHLACTVCQPGELFDCLNGLRLFDSGKSALIITDSQAFRTVADTIKQFKQSNNQTIPTLRLTSFSVLFARQKGDIAAYVRGLSRIAELKDGDRVLIAEGCTHHRQCNDIGAVKIPKALAKLTGGKSLAFEFVSGNGFPESKNPNNQTIQQFSLVVHCGGCMLTRREMLRRIAVAQAADVPIVNYGLVLAAANGLKPEEVLV